MVRAGSMPTRMQADTSNALGASIQRLGSCGVRGKFCDGGPKNVRCASRSEYATLNTLASVAIAGRPMRSQGASPAKMVSAKNISFDRNPLSSGTPAMAAVATIASVAVMGMARAEAAQPMQIARAGFVIDDAGGHEQRRLERGVVHHVEHGRDQRERAVHAEQQRDQTRDG